MKIFGSWLYITRRLAVRFKSTADAQIVNRHGFHQKLVWRLYRVFPAYPISVFANVLGCGKKVKELSLDWV